MVTKDDIPNIFGSLFAALVLVIPTSLLGTIVSLKSDFQLFTFKIGFLKYAGVIILVLGILIMIWCYYVFTFIGKGTPMHLSPPTKFVSVGLYRYSRNPMATGFCLIWIGEGIFFESHGLFIITIVFFLIYNLVVLFIEEPQLRADFGESYERYCTEVPRWIPRLRPYRGND